MRRKCRTITLFDEKMKHLTFVFAAQLLLTHLSGDAVDVIMKQLEGGYECFTINDITVSKRYAYDEETDEKKLVTALSASFHLDLPCVSPRYINRGFEYFVVRGERKGDIYGPYDLGIEKIELFNGEDWESPENLHFRGHGTLVQRFVPITPFTALVDLGKPSVLFKDKPWAMVRVALECDIVTENGGQERITVHSVPFILSTGKIGLDFESLSEFQKEYAGVKFDYLELSKECFTQWKEKLSNKAR